MIIGLPQDCVIAQCSRTESLGALLPSETLSASCLVFCEHPLHLYDQHICDFTRLAMAVERPAVHWRVVPAAVLSVDLPALTLRDVVQGEDDVSESSRHS